jgi:hypothetical protein
MVRLMRLMVSRRGRSRQFWLAGAVVLTTACATLQQLAALRQVAFALAGVRNGRLAGVDLARIRSYSDLTATDIGRISLALARKDLPIEFVVDVRAENPPDNKVTATMVRLAWSLLLNDKETISGVVDTTLSLPPGVPVGIPMQMRLNLLQFFDGPAQSMVDLAASIAGLSSDPTRIAIRAVPTIDTPIGRISYPSPITIVSRTVGGTRGGR